jgi:hypothetical protein
MKDATTPVQEDRNDYLARDKSNTNYGRLFGSIQLRWFF